MASYPGHEAPGRRLRCRPTSKLFPSSYRLSTSGLENPLVHVLFVLVLLIYRREKNDPSTTFWLFLCAGLLVLARMACILLVARPFIHHLWTVRSKAQALRASLALTPVTAWILFSLVYYGFPLPNTAYAKMNLGISQKLLFARRWNYLMDNVQRDPLTLFVIAGSIVVAFFSKQSRATLVMLGPLLYIFRALEKMRITRKKTLYATEQNSDRVGLIPWLFRSVQRKISACDVLFLDETSIHLSMSRAYGRCACSQR